MRLVYEQHNWAAPDDYAPTGNPAYVQVVAFVREYGDDYHLPAGVIKCLHDNETDFEVYERAKEHELIRAAITLYDEAVARAERKDLIEIVRDLS